jgi:16S rRNA A1518/A1519 N6-dimethyltransferase RsmA/KsgA/DIM1 with predicted DNA glycosylase/AP lyase activity
MSTTGVPLVKQLLDIYGVRAQKEFSQNFLLNNSILSRISGLITRVDQRTLIVEIGSGPASLTRHLLERKPAKVIGLEVDRRFEPILTQLAEANSDAFSPVFRNALDIEEIVLEHLLKAPQAYDSISIVGNLPFGVASLILQRLLHLFDHARNDTPALLEVSLILMFQLEVAQVCNRTVFLSNFLQKIAAKVGSESRGRLSIASQSQFHVDLPMVLNGADFVPPPKVQAGVLRFIRKPAGQYPSYQSLSRLTGVLFARQNRQISRILKGHHLHLPSDLAHLAELRPYHVTNEDFQRLALWFQHEYSHV